jgi:hypothetical protein
MGVVMRVPNPHPALNLPRRREPSLATETCAAAPPFVKRQFGVADCFSPDIRGGHDADWAQFQIFNFHFAIFNSLLQPNRIPTKKRVPRARPAAAPLVPAFLHSLLGFSKTGKNWTFLDVEQRSRTCFGHEIGRGHEADWPQFQILNFHFAIFNSLPQPNRYPTITHPKKAFS